MNRPIVLTRGAALDRLTEAVPRFGPVYAANRNTDAGPLGRATTSELSPYLRRRLLLEQEVVGAALAEHGPKAAQKFIDEVFWRSYFKGNLEAHPAAWTSYLDDVAAERERLAANSGLRRAYQDAVSGRTGIDGFDDWARELVEHGWLHNHARMWFASIWVFTLRLPWVLGADFFLQNLLDGDPASNTLSWRWVAGLHTQGKAYAARAENIRRFTDGRFSPTGLNESPEPLQEIDPPSLVPLPSADPVPTGDVALLLHLDDLNPETLKLGCRVTRVGGLVAHAPNASEQVRQADREAMADALDRAGQWFGCAAAIAVPGWEDGLPVVAAWAPVGPSADALPPGCLRVRRQWDELTWPHATRGYFQVKSATPAILRAMSPG
ncbi:deoxyribodipyrimidine photolyase [Lichenicola cladoniae]|uniref:Deoxyribodipyrimidine photolyase n=1 Tax=Lichenicola cladoniae TaxID=1484109 RepID=A0A6M8HPJ0_9PROT|nr:FAD-binding domain-containing protein [Lichenicola cladoniae]NPD66592.1 deoxyribodipyrimidine photolyase [Acetobacteraceae bacterium]QKE90200.1 deoxyribodipyrimidine photolyase [Lichenicola cladoniae]